MSTAAKRYKKLHLEKLATAERPILVNSYSRQKSGPSVSGPSFSALPALTCLVVESVRYVHCVHAAGHHSESDEAIMESDDSYGARRASGCGPTDKRSEQLCASCR